MVDGKSLTPLFGNILRREVHKQLVASGMEPWPGVPGNIAHENLIRTWLTDEKILQGLTLVQESNAKPLQEVAEFLMTSHGEAWAEISFPMEIKDITADYAIKKEALGELFINPHERYQPEGEPLGHLLMEEITKYEDLLVDKTPEERIQKLKELFESLENDKQAAIGDKVRELTMSAVLEYENAPSNSPVGAIIETVHNEYKSQS